MLTIDINRIYNAERNIAQHYILSSVTISSELKLSRELLRNESNGTIYSIQTRAAIILLLLINVRVLRF